MKMSDQAKEQQKNLLWGVWLRYAAICVTGLIAMDAHRFGLFPFMWAIWALIPLALIEGIWLHVRFRRWKSPEQTFWAMLFLDNFLITASVYFSGSLASPFVTLYLFAAIGNSFFIGPRLSVSGILTSVGFYGAMLLVEALGIVPILPVSHGGGEKTYLVTWIVTLASYLIMVGYLGWRMALDLRKKREETKKQTEVLLSLHQSLKAIATSHDITETFSRVLKAASALTGLEYCGIFLLDESGENVREAASNVDRTALGDVREMVFPCTGTRIGECIRENSPLVMSDVGSQVSDYSRWVVKSFDVRSALLVPLSLRGKSLGVLITATSRQIDEFPSSLVSSAVNLAGQASVAIENARLYVAQKEALEISAALMRVADGLAGIVDPDEMKREITRLARELMGSERTGLWLYDGGKKAFVFGEADGLPEEGKAYLRTVALIPSMAPIIKKMTEGKNSIAVEDTGQTALLPRDLMEKFFVRSIMVTPLHGRGGLMGGMLYLYTASSHRFTQHEISIADSVAPIIAGAIERARAFRAMEEKSSLLEAAIRTSEWINLQGTEGEMVKAIVKNMGIVFPFQHILVRLWDEGAGVLKSSYGPGYPDGSLTKNVRPGEGLSGASFQRMKPVMVGDFFDDKEHVPELPGARSALVLPLVAFGKAWGVLHIESHLPDHFAGEAGSVLGLFANQLAVGIRNFRLYEQSGYLKTYLENLIENADAVMIVTDAAGRITTWNKKAEETFGYAKSEALGRIAGRLLVEEKQKSKLAEAMKELSVGKTIENFESVSLTKSGERRQGIFSLAPILGKDGTVSEIIVVGHDITHVKIMEGQIKQSEKLAILGQLSAGLAHELNNPLTMISSQAQLLKARCAGAERQDEKEKVEAILKAAERIQALSGGLLSFARPKDDVMGPVNIGEVMDQALLFSEFLLRKKGVHAEYSCDPATPPVLGLRDEILQVCLNILSNAGDAIVGDRAGRIMLKAQPWDTHYVKVEVSDNGEGIPEEHLQRIFEPFFSTKPEGQGTGLGLSIVMRIVTAHNGRMAVRSTVGEGTTITILLPAWRQ